MKTKNKADLYRLSQPNIVLDQAVVEHGGFIDWYNSIVDDPVMNRGMSRFAKIGTLSRDDKRAFQAGKGN